MFIFLIGFSLLLLFFAIELDKHLIYFRELPLWDSIYKYFLILLIAFFAMQKLFSLMEYGLFIFAFVVCFWFIQKITAKTNVKKPFVFPRSFTFLCVTFKTLMRFELIFVSRVR